MILVMGASGKVGREVVKGLMARGARFRAGYRSSQKAAEARQSGIETAVLDYAEAATVRAALNGIERAFLVTSPSPELTELEGNVVQAALTAGVSQIVKLSVWGADRAETWLGRLHHSVEERIKSSGLAYTFLRPNSFMQNLLGQAQSIRSQGAFYLPGGDARVSDIDVRDIGRAAAAVLTTGGHRNKAYELSGPQALSYVERAEILTSVLGRTVRFIAPPDAEWKQAVLGIGMPEWLADALIDFQHAAQRGALERITPAVQELTGRAPVSFRQFIEDHAGVLK